MIRLIVLLQLCGLALAGPISVTTVAPARCPDGFALLNELSCVKLFETPRLYQEALNSCKNINGGNLASVKSEMENSFLVNLAAVKNSVHPIWLGLICYSSANSSCNWADATGTTAGYSNFARGNPKSSSGNNVYMLTSGSSSGKWVSADGNVVMLNYFCEVPAIGVETRCPNEFNESCYIHNQTLVTEADARQSCQDQFFGQLVSIHSQEENDHVQSLIRNTSLARIGARTNGVGMYWDDGSYFDFNNFANFSPDAGNCSAMQILQGSVVPGKWLSDSCDEKIGFVCKRLKGHSSRSPTPGPTFNPNNCYGTHNFIGQGEIVSPNYPNSYFGMGTPCTYIFTVPSNQIAQIKFPVLKLDAQSTISLYTGIEGTVPIIELTGSTSASGVSYSSGSNVLKMVFKNEERKYDATTKWSANYGWNL
ncbi:unnamed protein product [Caenorhabditis brenneri]